MGSPDARQIDGIGGAKATPGRVNVPVVLGGVTVHPGDAVCADDDGVVVVPHGEVDWCRAQVDTRLAREADKRARLADGELASTSMVYGGN